MTELRTFECDGCLGTYTGKPVELAGEGWVRHGYTARVSSKRGSILLCNDCESRYSKAWKKAA